jgi:hypothetical protein
MSMQIALEEVLSVLTGGARDLCVQVRDDRGRLLASLRLHLRHTEPTSLATQSSSDDHGSHDNYLAMLD